jgi:hypothetical protein
MVAGDGEVVGSVAAGAQRGRDELGRIGSRFGDRGDRPGACQDRGGGQAQDAGQRVTAATGSSRVGDGGGVGRQMRGFVVSDSQNAGALTRGRRFLESAFRIWVSVRHTGSSLVWAIRT